ncbi:MAG: glycoside hydrolase family 20 protein [Paludibacter sp.]|nr:glycoside hydrolase family 20 protein [Paludibacter sp.]
MIKTSSFFIQRLLGIFLLLGTCSFSSVSAVEYNIIPYPQQLIPKSGSFTFNNRTKVVCSSSKPEVLRLAGQFADQIKVVTGLKLEISYKTSHDTANSVIFQSSVSTNPEGYKLSVSPKTIRIQAGAANGFFYALQTLYQLMPVEIYGKKQIPGKNWSANAVLISDSPRFGYRGLHLDVCRHFFPLEFIKKYIDAMAIHKFNTFHWHLTDDQGWRIEIRKYPRLTEVGSRRDETLVGYYFERFPQQYDGKPSGGFYTQKEAREIVAYAKDRFITVIPEIEMPGHAQAAIASYPYLSCTPDSVIKVATKWGIFKDVYCPSEVTFNFLEDVLTEVMDIFPSKYIHIGGDECLKDLWKKSQQCQEIIKKLNLKDENGLQSYFIERIEKFVNSKGRQIIGWDEILDGGLAPNATVMSWRGIAGGITAAKSGHDVIMTPGTHCYFDKYQSDPETEPVTIGGYLPLSMVYQYEPIPAELTASEAKHVLGAQANMWTEYMPTTKSVEHMAYPRLSAMAEVIWSPKESRNWESFRRRMPSEFARYNQLDIQPSMAFYDVQFKTTTLDNKKLQFTLLCEDPTAQIHYTTGDAIPTLTDALYTAPVTLDKSSTVTAAAFVDGKIKGKSITKSLLVSKLTGLPYIISFKNSWYDGGNKNALTDGIPGNTKVYTQWVGLAKKANGEVTVDMQNVQKIERFSVGLLNATALCVIFPTEIKLLGSIDGTNYQLLAEKQIPVSTLQTWDIIRPELTFPSTEVRYLRLQLTCAGPCAADKKENPGGSVIFMDEIGAW